MPRSVFAVAILLLPSPTCRRESPRPSATLESRTAALPTPQDTGFVGTTAPLDRHRPGRPGAVRTLRGVDVPPPQTAAGPGQVYDRIVFEFSGDSVPGYHIEYSRVPVRRCGSGDPVSVAGTARLVVRFEPARAHDDQGNPLPRERDLMLGLQSVREAKLVCDFEGQVEWVLGIATAAPYRVTELTGPARLLLDVKQEP